MHSSHQGERLTPVQTKAMCSTTSVNNSVRAEASPQLTSFDRLLNTLHTADRAQFFLWFTPLYCKTGDRGLQPTGAKFICSGTDRVFAAIMFNKMMMILFRALNKLKKAEPTGQLVLLAVILINHSTE